jgi:hypothetical protein
MRLALAAFCVGFVALAGQAQSQDAESRPLYASRPDAAQHFLRPVEEDAEAGREGRVRANWPEIAETISLSRRYVENSRAGIAEAREMLKRLRFRALAEAERIRAERERARQVNSPASRDLQEGPSIQLPAGDDRG